MRLISILFLLTPLWSQASEPQACAGTIDELKTLVGDHAFPLRWEESSMTDGKPLVVSIMQKEGALHLEFLKTREGLWAESAGSFAGLEPTLRRSSARTRSAPGQPPTGCYDSRWVKVENSFSAD